MEIDREIINGGKGEKIHTKPTQKHMEVNMNKTEVLTDRPELMSEYSLPVPSNLNCLLNDGNNSCSWDLKTDLAQYISYMLSYRTRFTAPRLREWDVSLPSPVHSKVSEVSQHPQMDHFPCCTELKDPDISNAQIVDVHPQLSSFDSENTLTADTNNHGCETEGNRVILHVDDLCLVSLCSSGNLMGIDGPFQPRTSNFHDPVLPCSKGYMPNPGTTQNASQEACCLNVDMGVSYMDCPEPDLISSKQRTNPHSLHRQQDLNTDVFRLPAPGRL